MKRLLRNAFTVSLSALAVAAPFQHSFGQLLNTPFQAKDLAASVDAAVRDGTWSKHLEYVENGLANTAAAQPAGSDHSRWNRMLDVDTVELALAQSAFIRRFSPATLDQFSGSAADAGDFLRWLARDEQVLRSCLMTIEPSNRGDRVLERWAQLWRCNTNAWDRYWNLGLACALVFDKPLPFDRHISRQGLVDIRERYDFFRNSCEHNRLKTDLPHLPVWDLVWVVDAPVPDTDLVWAQDHVRFSRAEWAKAYDLVAYRMDQATEGAKIHPTYTLEEILRVGGVCVERAHFAAMSAKANGIPATPLVGEGERGGHAWFAFLPGAHVWNLSAGRYGPDQFATGYTSDPQSRQRITEQSLNLLVDTQRASPQYLLATRLYWLGQLTLARQDAKSAIALFRAAVEISPRHVPAWNALLAALQAVGTSTKTEWKNILQLYRCDFKDFADMSAKADRLECEVLLVDANADEILKSLRNETRQMKEKNREDLVLQAVNRHVILLQNAGKTNVILSVYQSALQEFGDELPILKSLAVNAFKFAHGIHREADMLRTIEQACRHHLATPSQDVFRAKAQANLASMLAGFYDTAGQLENAKRYKRLAEKLAP